MAVNKPLNIGAVARILALFLCLTSTFTKAQKSLASPRDSARGEIQGANVSVNYGSPSVKGREIWGRLVPYGQVWRSGANEATVFTTNKSLKIENSELPPGRYSLFTIPARDRWTVVFNKVPEQWGAFEYDPKQDALRVEVEPLQADSLYERLKYEVKKDQLVLKWEKLMLPVRISAAGGK